jgi:hypothetical protein
MGERAVIDRPEVAALAAALHEAKTCDPEWGPREHCAPGAHHLDARFVLAANPDWTYVRREEIEALREQVQAALDELNDTRWSDIWQRVDQWERRERQYFGTDLPGWGARYFGYVRASLIGALDTLARLTPGENE